MAEEFTAKFKVDVSDLKKGITDATKSIKQANAAFKAETAGMDKWSTNADGLSAKLKQLGENLKSQKSILSSYEQQLKKQQDAYDENGKRAEQLKAKLQELASQGIAKTDAEYKNYEKALRSVVKEQQNNEQACDDLKLKIQEQKATVTQTETAIKKYTDAQTKLEAESKSLISATEKQERQLAELKTKYVETAATMGEGSDEAKELAKQIQSLSSELQENKSKISSAEKAADSLDATMENLDDATAKTSDGFTVMKGALANLVADGIRRAISAMADFAKETVKVGKEFDSAMSQVGAVSGAAAEDLEMLRDKAKEMGSTTKFTATEAAEAFNYMAMAGWKTEDMLEGIEGVLNLAAASGSDLATTSDIVTDALTAMGYSAKDAGKLADVMAAASSNANTNVEMMGQTFQYAAPIVGALGYSMEDTAVAIGLMANAGIKGEKAGTALRSVLTRLSAPPKECATAMDALGISITDSNGEMKDLDTVIGDLRKAFSKLSETQQTQYAKQLAGQEAMSGLLAIVNAAPSDFDKLTAAVEGSNGAAEEMAKTMMDNLGGDMTLFKSKLEGVQIAIYEKFEPALRKGVDILSKLLDAIMWVVDHSEQFVTALKAMGAAIAAYVAYTTALKAMQLGWDGIKKAIMATTVAQKALNVVQNASPLGLVLAGVAALTTAVIAAVDSYGAWADETYGLNEEQQELIDSINEQQESINKLKEARDKANQSIDAESAYNQQLWDELKNITDENGNIKKGYEDRAAVITGILSEALGQEITIVDGQIQKYDELKQSINELIAAKRAEALLDANKEAYTQAIQNQADAYSQYSKVVKDFTETEKQLAEAEADLAEKKELLNSNTREAQWLYTEASDKVNILTEKYNEQKTAVEQAETNYLDYANTIKNYEGLMAAVASGDADKLSEAMNNLSSSFMTAENATKEMLENQLKNFQDNYKAMKEAVEMGMPGVTQEMVNQAKDLVDRAKAELDKTPTNLSETLVELQTLASQQGVQIPVALAESIRTGMYAVPQSVEELQSLVTFDKLIQLADETGVKVPKNVTKGIADGSMLPSEAVAIMCEKVDFNDVVKRAKEAGVDVPKYIKQGVKDGTMEPVEAINAMQDLVQFNNLTEKATEAGIEVPNIISTQVKNGSMKPKEAVDEMQSLITFSDLLGKAEKAGIDVPDSLTAGINSGEIKPSEAIKKLNDLVVIAADNTKEMKSAGADTVGGFVEGLREKTADGDTAAQDFINSVIDAAKTAQESHSPSKVWRDEIGKSAGEGYALGLQDAMSNASGAASKLVNNTLATVKKALTSIVSATNSGGGQIKKSVSATMSAIASYIQSGSAKIKSIISSMASNLASQFGNIGTKMKSQVTAAINSAVSTFQSGQKKINSIFTGLSSKLTSEFSKMSTKLKSQATAIVNALIKTFNDGATKLKSIALKIANTMVTALKNSRSAFVSAGSYMAQGMKQGFLSQEGNANSEIVAMVRRIVANVKASMKIKSPSKVFEDIGVNMALGLIKGIKDKEQNAKKSAEELSKLYVDAAKTKVDSLKSNNKISKAAEVSFWKTIVANTKKGTTAYKTAMRKLATAKTTLQNDVSSLTKTYANDVKKVNDELKKDIASVNDTLEKNIEALKQTYSDTIKERTDSILGSLNLFDTVKLDDVLSRDTLLKNLKTQVNALKEWDSILDSLRKRITNEDLLSDLENQGIGSLDILKNINKMTDSELSEYQSLYSQRAEIAKERALTEGEKLLASTNAQIAKLQAQADSDIAKLNTNAQAELAKLKKTYISGMKKLGVDGTKTGKEVGNNIANGIKAGFAEAMKGVTKSTKAELNNLLTAIKKQLKISSPSKVYAGIGGFMAEGLGVGFVNEMKSVNRDIKKAMPTVAANSLLGQLQGAIGGANAGSMTNNKTMNFTQNIYAPQQPSRIELYRQTKNLIALAGRGI